MPELGQNAVSPEKVECVDGKLKQHSWGGGSVGPHFFLFNSSTFLSVHSFLVSLCCLFDETLRVSTDNSCCMQTLFSGTN